MPPKRKNHAAQVTRKPSIASVFPNLSQGATASQADEQTPNGDNVLESDDDFDQAEDPGRNESQAMLEAVTALALGAKELRDPWADERKEKIEKDRASVLRLVGEQKHIMDAKETRYKDEMRSLLTSILSMPISKDDPLIPAADQKAPRSSRHPLEARGKLLVRQSRTLVQAWQTATTFTSVAAFPPDITSGLEADKKLMIRALECGKRLAQADIDTLLQHRRAEELMKGRAAIGSEGGASEEERKAISYFSRKRKSEGDDNEVGHGGGVETELNETLRRVEGGVRKMVRRLPPEYAEW